MRWGRLDLHVAIIKLAVGQMRCSEASWEVLDSYWGDYYSRNPRFMRYYQGFAGQTFLQIPFPMEHRPSKELSGNPQFHNSRLRSNLESLRHAMDSAFPKLRLLLGFPPWVVIKLWQHYCSFLEYQAVAWKFCSMHLLIWIGSQKTFDGLELI